MVRIGYDSGKCKAYVLFDGSNFNELLSLMKSKRFSYNKTLRRWEGTPYKVWNVIDDIQDIENIISDTSLVEKHIYDFGEKETQFVRNRFDKSSLKVDPVVGKPPYEDFQLTSVRKGISQNRLALYLGMGSGKTYVLINIINHLWSKKKIDKILIVAPSEGLVNWRREILKFSDLFSKDDICISMANQNRNFLIETAKIVILTYRHFLTLSDDYYTLKNKNKNVKKYRKSVIPFEKWGSSRCIVLDESHHVKNLQARSTHILMLHKKYFDYRYLATGTPSPNNFGELYSQMKFLDESILPNYYEWTEEVASVGNRFSKYAINFFYPEKIKKWEKIFSPWVIRLRSNDILTLPDLYVKRIYIEMPELQSEIYKRLINYMIFVSKEENNGRVVPRFMYNKFPYISQALDNPCLLKGKLDPSKSGHLTKIIDKFKFENHGKMPIIKSLVEKYRDGGKKIVIFDYHPLTLDSLGNVFKKLNPIVLHGQSRHPAGITTNAWRDVQLNIFKQDRDRNLLIASSKILSTSINLQEATAAIYFSRDYSFLSWDQSQKRLHRIGQDEPVIINPLIFENSLDERLDKILDYKKDLDESIFQKDSLSVEEWRKVFTGKLLNENI